MRTNEATRAPAVVAGEALAFLLATRPLLVGPHRDKQYIFNMDQTPLWFSYHRSKTLQLRGATTVHVRKSTNDTRRATAALTCTAAGEFLRPMIIFKGTPKGLIVKKELVANLLEQVTTRKHGAKPWSKPIVCPELT
jgi:hypothetical protein